MWEFPAKFSFSTVEIEMSSFGFGQHCKYADVKKYRNMNIWKLEQIKGALPSLCPQRSANLKDSLKARAVNELLSFPPHGIGGHSDAGYQSSRKHFEGNETCGEFPYLCADHAVGAWNKSSVMRPNESQTRNAARVTRAELF